MSFFEIEKTKSVRHPDQKPQVTAFLVTITSHIFLLIIKRGKLAHETPYGVAILPCLARNRVLSAK